MKVSVIILASLFTLLSLNTFCQSREFRFGAHGGFVFLTSNDHETDKGAFGGRLDGEYLLNEQIGIGLDIGFITLKNSVNVAGLSFDNELLLPILFKGRYYFATYKVQPYASLGFGLGLFIAGGNDLITDPSLQTNVNLKPELGIRIYWFSIAAAYSYSGNYNVEYRSDPISYNYMEISIGINLYFGF